MISDQLKVVPDQSYCYADLLQTKVGMHCAIVDRERNDSNRGSAYADRGNCEFCIQ
ncbi:hypothetical protein [Olivibacter domesticus]|uniref:hypothetical protein n=1 Tax=Olivibacter domesticus TaxID=407022 RepID=UPI0013904445|nr:hypothetical protein [Olivibacter domesticus]